ncbi:hypothetical protein F5884DRAFT_808987 [Xylogone sp. PMI_703]|nr:hypothetical protein F5884DRAFT_808987 [Xylogone sp. PMI_703]
MIDPTFADRPLRRPTYDATLEVVDDPAPSSITVTTTTSVIYGTILLVPGYGNFSALGFEGAPTTPSTHSRSRITSGTPSSTSSALSNFSINSSTLSSSPSALSIPSSSSITSSTFSSSLNTSSTLSNSSVTSSTLSSSPSFSITSSAPSSSPTSTSYPTNTAINVGGAYCFTPADGNYVSFTETQAKDVVESFCSDNYVLEPSNTYGQVNELAGDGYSVVVSASWAPDQTSCGTMQPAQLDDAEGLCYDAWDTDFFCDNETGNETTSYGGAYVLVLPDASGCILLSLYAYSTG